MNKKIILLTLLMATTLIAPVLAKAPTGPAGKSNIIQLLLVEKDPTDWTVVDGGAFGKMTYNNMTGDFVFNGHGLNPSEDYTLVNFARDTEWPAHVNILGTGTPNNGGNVQIKGTFSWGVLEYDETPGTGTDAGYKIWLVLYGDLLDSTLSGWNPTEYLFEDALI